MRVLVLGGTHFVGRAVVEEALLRGDTVTALNRGVSGVLPAGARPLHADRRDPEALDAALSGGEWDVVVDTWSAEPAAVSLSARLLSDRAGHYGYVSSRSVYRWPLPAGLDETGPLVDGDPEDANAGDYAAAKRGGEIAVEEAFAGRSLIARAGLVLGPYEDVGRLPWWLARLRRGGRVLAPGPPTRPLQYVDARDLGSWMLASAERGLAGAFNTVSRPGHTDMGELIAAAERVTEGHAELVWWSPQEIDRAGLSGWTQLPIWAPPSGELASLHDGDVTAAHREGLTCRPVFETVADTWEWLQRDGFPAVRTDRPPVGLDRDLEEELLSGRGG